MNSTIKNSTTNYVLESYRLDATQKSQSSIYKVLISAMLFVLSLFIFSSSAVAQSVGFNNPNPHAKSLIDLTSSDKGLLTPRMTAAQRMAMFPLADATAKGMLVYQTDNTQGFYYYDGAQWIYNGNEKTSWNTTGNAGTTLTSNFMGTIDSVGLKFKTNNIDAINISANQKVTIGSAGYYSTLYVRGTDSAIASLTVRNLSTSGISGMWAANSAGSLVGQAGYANATAPAHAGNFAVGSLTNVPFTFITSNVERARFDSNGNFGIDTIAPQARMHVKSNSSSVWPQILVEERDSADFSRISFMNKGSNKFWTTAARSEQVDSISFYNVYNSSTGNLLTLRGDNKMGLGVSNPMYPLTFQSTIGDKISFWGGYGNHYGIGIQGYLMQIHSAAATDDIAFGYGSSAAFTETVRIKGTGNVGIGTNAPLQKMDVAGNINMANDTNNIRINNIRVLSVKGTSNLFVGSFAGINTTGVSNTFIGDSSGISNTGGAANTAVGSNAMKNNTTGTWNTAIGNAALQNNTTGFSNSAMGIGTMINNTTGYRNTAIGGGGLQNNTTGFENTALGYYSLIGNKTANYNVGIGAFALYADSIGDNNVAVGHSSGFNVTTGSKNVLIGKNAGQASTTSSNNVFIGYEAGKSNTIAEYNTFIGSEAGKANTTGNYNSFVGFQAGLSNTTGVYNSFMGLQSGMNNTTGTENTFYGAYSGTNNTTGARNSFFGNANGSSNTTGNYNSFGGWGAGNANTTGEQNTFFGAASGYVTTTGSYNTGFGTDALKNNVTGANNVSIGRLAGFNTTSNNNTFVGHMAGLNNTTGSNNIAIGNNAQVGATLTNAIAIGSNATTTVNNSMVLGGTGANAVNVGIGFTNPEFPLSFAGTTGDKISFWGGSGPHYGIGIQGYLLQIHSAAVSDDIVFGYGSSAAFTENMRIKGNGDVGIGTSAPTATLEVNGFTKLGTDAPAVKMKKYTGNTAATTNGNINFAHGLNQAKILSVEVLVSNSGGTLYPPENASSSGAFYHYFVTATAVYIANDASNAANILNRPYRVLITYEE